MADPCTICLHCGCSPAAGESHTADCVVTIRCERDALRAQVERLQAAGQVPLGYMNAGHLHEMRQGRLPHAYLYPAEGVGASVPVYTTLAQEAADTGADERGVLAKLLATHAAKQMFYRLDSGEGVDTDDGRTWLAARAAIAARAGQVAAPAMVPVSHIALQDAWNALNPQDSNRDYFTAGVRWAERAHGIGLTVGGSNGGGAHGV